MQVRFTQDTFVGNRTHAAGEVTALPDAQAKRLVTAGHATPVPNAPPVETAELPGAGGDERADVPTRRKTKGK